MLRERHWAIDDDGSGALEFVTLGTILLVPLVYLVLALGTVQEQTFGVEAPARLTARAIALAEDPQTALARGDEIIAGIVDEYGIDPDAVQVTISCVPADAVCPSAGTTMTVTVATRTPLPLLPAFLGIDHLASVPIEAAATQKMSRQWGSG